MGKMVRSGENNIALQGFGWAVCIVAVIGIAWYVVSVRNELNKQYTHQITQANASYDAVKQRYKYISLNNQLFLVPSSAIYAQANGLWTLVNKAHSLPIDYAPTHLTTVRIPKYQNESAVTARDELQESLVQLSQAAQKDNVQLMVRSAFRSANEQRELYDATQQTGGGEYVAVPGTSEHQTGLAIDFNTTDSSCVTTCALSNKGAGWLAIHAAEYGFILRYPTDKVTITGYPSENWHYRYVGTKLALAMKQANLTLEEVYPLFKEAKARN